MQALTLKETELVSGGAGEALVIGSVVVITLATLSYLASSSSYSSPCKTFYEEKVSYYDVVTPVYDAYGVYQGDIVSTYADTSYVPVTVCA